MSFRILACVVDLVIILQFIWLCEVVLWHLMLYTWMIIYIYIRELYNYLFNLCEFTVHATHYLVSVGHLLCSLCLLSWFYLWAGCKKSKSSCWNTWGCIGFEVHKLHSGCKSVIIWRTNTRVTIVSWTGHGSVWFLYFWLHFHIAFLCICWRYLSIVTGWP